MFATGPLTLNTALASFRGREPGAAGYAALSGGGSIRWMALVNFVLNLHSKWLVLALALQWIIALTLYSMERNIQ